LSPYGAVPETASLPQSYAEVGGLAPCNELSDVVVSYSSSTSTNQLIQDLANTADV